jgi:hypothetical protein
LRLLVTPITIAEVQAGLPPADGVFRNPKFGKGELPGLR